MLRARTASTAMRAKSYQEESNVMREVERRIGVLFVSGRVG
jgi:hypothetical protein